MGRKEKVLIFASALSLIAAIVPTLTLWALCTRGEACLFCLWYNTKETYGANLFLGSGLMIMLASLLAALMFSQGSVIRWAQEWADIWGRFGPGLKCQWDAPFAPPS